MRNVLFVDISGNVQNAIAVMNHRKYFNLRYTNPKCALLELNNDNRRVNVWITTGIYSKHNLMTYDRLDAGYILIMDNIDGGPEVFTKIDLAFNQLSRKSSKVYVLLKCTPNPNIAFKKRVLQWCIDKNGTGVPYIEFKECDEIFKMVEAINRRK